MIPDDFVKLRENIRVKMNVILDTGSDSAQGIIMRGGKKLTHKDEYKKAAGICYLNDQDMLVLNVTEGGKVKLTSGEGSISLYAKASENPPGVVFVPKGPWINSIVEAETLQTGSPNYKGMSVKVEATDDEVIDLEELLKNYMITKNK